MFKNRGLNFSLKKLSSSDQSPSPLKPYEPGHVTDLRGVAKDITNKWSRRWKPQPKLSKQPPSQDIIKQVMKRNRSSADNLKLKQVLEAHGIKADPKTDPMAVIEALIELAGKN